MGSQQLILNTVKLCMLRTVWIYTCTCVCTCTCICTACWCCCRFLESLNSTLLTELSTVYKEMVHVHSDCCSSEIHLYMYMYLYKCTVYMYTVSISVFKLLNQCTVHVYMTLYIFGDVTMHTCTLYFTLYFQIPLISKRVIKFPGNLLALCVPNLGKSNICTLYTYMYMYMYVYCIHVYTFTCTCF